MKKLISEIDRFREDVLVHRTIVLDKTNAELEKLKVKVKELEHLLERNGNK